MTWQPPSAGPYLVAPLVVRRLTSDATTSTTSTTPTGADATVTTTLPEGCAAGVWLHAVHRDESVWDHPHSFLPGRWLLSPG